MSRRPSHWARPSGVAPRVRRVKRATCPACGKEFNEDHGHVNGEDFRRVPALYCSVACCFTFGEKRWRVAAP